MRGIQITSIKVTVGETNSAPDFHEFKFIIRIIVYAGYPKKNISRDLVQNWQLNILSISIWILFNIIFYPVLE